MSFLPNCHIKFICFRPTHASRNRPNRKTNLLNSMNEIRIVNEIIAKWSEVKFCDQTMLISVNYAMLECASFFCFCFTLWHLFYLGISFFVMKQACDDNNGIRVHKTECDASNVNKSHICNSLYFLRFFFCIESG